MNLVVCSACVSTFRLVLSLTRLCLLFVLAFPVKEMPFPFQLIALIENVVTVSESRFVC